MAINILYTAQDKPGRQAFWTDDAQRLADELGFNARLNPLDRAPSEAEWADLLADVDGLVTDWGAPRLTDAVLARNSRLKIVGHAAGSVAHIVSPDLFRRNIRVVTANRVMARAVAEYSLMMTFVALRHLGDYMHVGGRTPPMWKRPSEVVAPSRATIAIWGFGDSTRELIQLLEPLAPRAVIVADDHLDEAEAGRLGVRKVSFGELWDADVIHLLQGLTDETAGRVAVAQLESMKAGAVLVNCGRGPLVEEDALIAELQKGRISAILDVFHDEPLPTDDPLYHLPNVLLTPHVAGMGQESGYVPCVLEEFGRFFRGEPLQHEVSPERAMTMTVNFRKYAKTK